MQGAGGTSGGLVLFCGGCGLSALGLYSLFSRVMVSSGGMWHGYFGARYGAGASIGATIGPFIAGLAILFFNAKSKVGWAFTAGSLVGLTIEILSSLRVHLQPTPLPVLLLMLAAMGGGLGLVARSFRSQ